MLYDDKRINPPSYAPKTTLRNIEAKTDRTEKR